MGALCNAGEREEILADLAPAIFMMRPGVSVPPLTEAAFSPPGREMSIEAIQKLSVQMYLISGKCM